MPEKRRWRDSRQRRRACVCGVVCVCVCVWGGGFSSPRRPSPFCIPHQQKDHLRDELVDDRHVAAEVEVIEAAEDDTDGHLEHAKQNRHLHLVRVGEDEEVVGAVPCLSTRLRHDATAMDRMCVSLGYTPATQRSRQASQAYRVQADRVHVAGEDTDLVGRARVAFAGDLEFPARVEDFHGWWDAHAARPRPPPKKKKIACVRVRERCTVGRGRGQAGAQTTVRVPLEKMSL